MDKQTALNHIEHAKQDYNNKHYFRRAVLSALKLIIKKQIKE